MGRRVPVVPAPWRRLALLAAVLVGLIVGTWAIGKGHVASMKAAIPTAQKAAVETALAYIEQDFEGMQGQMEAVARQVAAHPSLMASLRHWRAGDREGSTEALVRHFATLAPPPGMAVELYDPSPQLVVWHGSSMSLDDGPSQERFLERPQVVMAVDSDKRKALVLWWPLYDQGQPLGALRLVRQVQFKAPVRNQYLRDISLSDTWTRATRLPVRVTYEATAAVQEREAEHSRLLEGIDGSILGRVYVQPPSEDQLLQAGQARYHHLMALWVMLLLGVLWWGIGRGYGAVANTDTSTLGQRLSWFAALVAGGVGVRYALLALDVPARWQGGKAPLAPLFDPKHLASAVGGGGMRSTGDLLITALFALLLALCVIHLVARICPQMRHLYRSSRSGVWGRWQGEAIALALLLAIVGVVSMLAVATRQAVLDSTLDYFARTGLLPERLVLVVFCALLILTLATCLTAIGLVRLLVALMPLHRRSWRAWGRRGVLGLALLIALAWVLWPGTSWAAAVVVVFFLGIALLGTQVWKLRPADGLGLFTLRVILPGIFTLAVLLYPMVYHGLDIQRRIRIEDAVTAFEEGNDPRVPYAARQLLERVQDDADVRTALAALTLDEASPEGLGPLAQSLLRGSLLASLGGYDVSLTFTDTTGAPVARHYQAEQRFLPTALDAIDRSDFDLLQQMRAEARATGVFVVPLTGRRELDRIRYAGLVPVYEQGFSSLIGWAMVQAEPRAWLREGATPFPRVLTQTNYYGNLYANMSLAEFRQGLLVRSVGNSFGRYRLDDEVAQTLKHTDDLWQEREVKDREYLTYYRRYDTAATPEGVTPFGLMAEPVVVAARTSSVNIFDHLYYLLRLTISGLFVGVPIYLVGLVLRRRAGQLPAPRVDFKGKVLNAFFAVGIITAAAMGFAGLQVVTGENERAIQSWLRQHLERVEQTLALDARSGELPYRVLDRTSVDSLAARVGLDLNIYRGMDLVASSRYQFIRDRLFDERLPIAAYQALYFDGFRFMATQEQVGTFTYTAGFRVLPDEQGQPRYILSVPTLPEQERIEEERARTVAYLFGSLLVLVLIVMVTAWLLAARLTKPIAQLRSGLQNIAQGRFARIPPVDSRDEIGELVETFNDMQGQLADSRRQLAQQERQLAWREMARQVAHEIKNPLTPMKLSVQHLQRAFEGYVRQRKEAPDTAMDRAEADRFEGLFTRITQTLIEQIDALARIANEFSTFARLPQQVLEELDVNDVVAEAVALMQAEAEIDVALALSDAPLVVRADREELRRIYINLIKNALQAADPKRQVAVSVETTRQAGAGQGWAYSRVTDNGKGIAPEVQGKIFEPNFSTKTSGAGLGLAIAKKSIKDLQGEIGFETEEGQGTTFWVRLPLVD